MKAPNKLSKLVGLALLVSLLAAGTFTVARAEFGITTAYGGFPRFYFIWKLPCDQNPGTWRDASARGKLTQAPTDRVRNAPSDGVVPAKAKKQ